MKQHIYIVTDAALEYENAKREGFLGTFVDWLNFKVEQFHKFMDNYDQIEELVKQIDEYKNVSFRYIVDIYLLFVAEAPDKYESQEREFYGVYYL